MKYNYSAIILAGGEGTRLRPLTLSTPKPLVKISGKPIISYLIEPLSKLSNVDDIQITISYLKEQFFQLMYSIKSNLLDSGNCGNMYCSFLQAISKTQNNKVICLSSDIYIEEKTFEDCINHFENSNSDVQVFLKKYKSDGYKSWDWKISSEETLNDIEVSNTKTVYEKFMIILDKRVIEQLTNNFTTNLGSTISEFQDYEKFNSGWIYLLKRLLEQKTTIKVKFLENLLLNLNTLSDIEKIENYFNNQKKLFLE